MRYERVEKCNQGDNVTGHIFCETCGESGEIHTPVEHTEMWAVVSPEGDYAKVHVGMPAISDSEGLVWAAMIKARRISGETADDCKKRLQEQGYTCKQIHVIRRES